MNAPAMITLNDGVQIPQLGVGVWRMDPVETRELVLAALEIGYRHIDCAAFYQNEAEVGAAIAESGLRRDELFITSKIWNDRHADPEAALAESLARFGLDQLDLCLIHWPSPQQDRYVDVWRYLLSAREERVIRSAGVSNFWPEHLDRIVAETGVAPSVNQIELHPSLQQAELTAANARHGVATEVWRPLGKGDFDTPVVRGIAEQIGCTPAQAVIRWHLQHGHIVFPKSAHRDRLAENFDVFGFTLSDEQMAAIDGLERGNRTGATPETMP